MNSSWEAKRRRIPMNPPGYKLIYIKVNARIKAQEEER